MSDTEKELIEHMTKNTEVLNNAASAMVSRWQLAGIANDLCTLIPRINGAEYDEDYMASLVEELLFKVAYRQCSSIFPSSDK